MREKAPFLAPTISRFRKSYTITRGTNLPSLSPIEPIQAATIIAMTRSLVRTHHSGVGTDYIRRIFNTHLASVTPLNLIFGVSSLERPGDNVTVNIDEDDGFSTDPPNYDQGTVSSMRELIDLSNFDNSLRIITTGESGQPFSAHYNNLNPLWSQNLYQQMVFSVRAQDKSSKGLLTLEPA